MKSSCLLLALPFLIPAAVFSQSYSISTIVGTTGIKDGVAASQSFLRRPYSVAIDGQGIIYIADNKDNRVRRIGKDGIISTVAGTGAAGYTGDLGTATSAKLSDPSSLAVDKAGTVLYICDRGNWVVRKVDLKRNIITTVAGNSVSPFSSGDGKLALLAGMSPDTIALDDAGNLYISEYVNNRIRKVDPATGIISAFAGIGLSSQGGDNGPAASAQISLPYSITTDGVNALYIADWGNSLIRKVDLHSNIITTIAGSGYPAAYGDGGAALDAGLEGPEGVSVDAAGNLLILDNNQLRFIAAGSTTISTVAGTGALGFAGDGMNPLSAQFAVPNGIAIVGPADFLVADSGNYRIRRATNGNMSTIAGFSSTDGLAPTATILNSPSMAASDSVGNLLIADTDDNRIRKVAATGSGTVSTIAGTGVLGWLNGRIAFPQGVAAGLNDAVYVADTSADRILQIDASGIKTIAGKAGTPGFQGDTQLASSARLDTPRRVRSDAQGNLYIADWGNHRVRKIDTNGVITTVAGNGQVASGSDNVAATASGMDPNDVAVDSAGNLYIADAINGKVRKVTTATGLITTVAGTGAISLNPGDGGLATKAALLYPTSVSVDNAGNLLIADYDEGTIRLVDARTGIITRVAGTGLGQYQSNAESGTALSINLGPQGITALADGTILVADSDNDRIRRLVLQVAKTLSISFGDKQSGAPGQRVTLTAAITDAKNLAVANTAVNFTVTSGTGTLANSSILTAADGTASAVLTLGTTPGPVTVRADSTGLAPVTFNLTIAAPAPPPVPVISTVSGLPQSQPPVVAMSKNALLLITGQNFLSTLTAIPVGDADLVNGTTLPTSFQGICVDVSGTHAPILSVSASQIIFQAPDAPVGTPATVTVLSACGTGQETPGAGVAVPVQATSPEFFYSLVNSDGTAQVAAMNYATSLPAASVQPGDQILVFLTGLGSTDPAFNPGDVVTGDAGILATVTLQLGEESFLPDYVGLAPALPGAPYGITAIKENAGVYEVLLTVPADAAPGNWALVASTGDASSPVTAMLNVVAPADGTTRESVVRQRHHDGGRTKPVRRAIDKN